MPDSADVKTQLKKRARRRLIGSVALAGFIAAVLPMIMDDEPEPPQSVRILIPGEETPFRPNTPVPPVLSAQTVPSASSSLQPSSPTEDASPPLMRSPASRGDARKLAGKPAAKPVEKTEERLTPSQLAEKKRAEDILGGRFSEPDPPGRFVILIGAFSESANVVSLQSKLGRLGVKTYTEPLELPGDKKKTRLRAGPFATKSAAEQALAKMKRIGVNGDIAAQPR